MLHVGGKRKGVLGVRAYCRTADRARAITMLRKQGFNYFVRYREGWDKAIELGQTHALQYSKVDWVVPGHAYID